MLAATSACASRGGAVPSPFPRPGGPTPTVAIPRPASPSAPAIVVAALELQGVPYKNGGTDPSGFDCSGYVWYVFDYFGVSVPRTTAAQYAAGQPVDVDAVEPGDLVFFSTISPGPSHVGIAINRLEFVHAPSSSGVVRVESLSASYWASRYVGARRIR
jgi:cell wall-associated NlpC family hydrolase